jgi:hypothetical protein
MFSLFAVFNSIIRFALLLLPQSWESTFLMQRLWIYIVYLESTLPVAIAARNQ